MSSVPKRTKLVVGLALVAIVAIVGVAVAVSGSDDAPSPVAEDIQPPATDRPLPDADEADHGAGDHEHGPDDHHEPDGDDPHAQGPPRIDEDELSADERRVALVVSAYVEALDERDGATVCRLLAPGAIDAVELPRERGGCAESVSASIGYRDPRGLPVWDSATVEGLLRVELDGDRAAVTATTVTRFADRDQPSIEDDVIHLIRDDGRWLIAKASSTLYRAVGIDDVPLRALTPPD